MEEPSAGSGHGKVEAKGLAVVDWAEPQKLGLSSTLDHIAKKSLPHLNRKVVLSTLSAIRLVSCHSCHRRKAYPLN